MRECCPLMMRFWQSAGIRDKGYLLLSQFVETARKHLLSRFVETARKHLLSRLVETARKHLLLSA
jgi:hypothetical protein